MMDVLRPARNRSALLSEIQLTSGDVDIFNIDESGNVDDINNQRYAGDVDNPSGNVDDYN